MANGVADVVIVGGGPAGSTAAAILARKGLRVTILDRAAFPRAKPCGDYLNPGCDAVLRRLGVRDAVVAAGAQPVRGMRVIAPDGMPLTFPFTRETGWALPRYELDHLLLAHAAQAGATVIEGARVVSIEEAAHHVVLGAEDAGMRRTSHAARFAIGADGLRSTVARMIGAGEPPRRGRYTVGAYLDGLTPGASPSALIDDRDAGEIHLGPDRYCGVAYLPGGRTNVTVALSRGELCSWRGNLERRYWETLRTFPDLAGRVTRARRVSRFQTSGPLGYWQRRTAAGRVLLAGDAAGHVDPMTGQGIFLALRGAELAAASALEALGGRDPLAAAMRRYERALRREFGPVFLISRILQQCAFRPAIVHRAIRRMALRPDLGARLMAAVGNLEPPGLVLRPGFVARVLGIV